MYYPLGYLTYNLEMLNGFTSHLALALIR
jgi:uncharacterized protein